MLHPHQVYFWYKLTMGALSIYHLKWLEGGLLDEECLHPKEAAVSPKG